MQLSLTNYGIIDKLTIKLDPGLTVLVGPNGSGKSTVVDGLFFVLTGETLDGANVGDRINWEAVDEKAVAKLSTDEFTLERVIKPSGVSHKLNVGETLLTKKGDINEWLFDKFNVDSADVLRDVFFAAQLRATDLFDATDNQRLALLSRVFGFDRLESCRAAIYKVLAETPVPAVNDQTIAVLTDNVEKGKARVAQLSDNLAKAKEVLTAFTFGQKEYDRIMAAPLDTEYDTHVQTLKNLEELKARIEPTWNDLTARQAKLKELEEESCRLTHYEGLTSRKQQFSEELEELKNSPNPEVLRNAMNEVVKQSTLIESEIEELKKRSNGAEVCPLTGGKPCIELLRLHDPELIRGEIKAREDKLTTMRGDYAQLQELYKAAERSRVRTTELTIELGTISRDLAELTTPTRTIDEIAQAIKEVGWTDTDRKSLAEVSKDWEQTCAGIALQTKWLEEHPERSGVTLEDRNKQEELYRWYLTASNDVQRIDAELKSAKESLSSSESTLACLIKDRERAESFQHRVDILKEVRELLSKGQLQRLLLQTTIKATNREIAACSKVFNFPYELFIEESGAISYRNDNIESADVRLLSGGQKYVAAIITRLAFARVLRTDFPFVVLDEPSTCLDDHSRELLSGLFVALRDRCAAEGRCMVVPTHDPLLVGVASNVVNIGE